MVLGSKADVILYTHFVKFFSRQLDAIASLGCVSTIKKPHKNSVLSVT